MVGATFYKQRTCKVPCATESCSAEGTEKYIAESGDIYYCHACAHESEYGVEDQCNYPFFDRSKCIDTRGTKPAAHGGNTYYMRFCREHWPLAGAPLHNDVPAFSAEDSAIVDNFLKIGRRVLCFHDDSHTVAFIKTAVAMPQHILQQDRNIADMVALLTTPDALAAIETTKSEFPRGEVRTST